jgi:histidine triad (HIT) family protein
MTTESNSDCLFCRLAADDSSLVWQSETVAAFRDIHPQAPVHLLVVPKKHIPSLAEVSGTDRDLLGELLLGAAEVAQQAGLEANGYRTIINTREHAGQAIDHLHVHVLGGEPLGPLRA